MALLKRHTAAPVVGIFEASVYAAVQLLRSNDDDDDDECEEGQQKQKKKKKKKKGGNDNGRGKYFGIVSTGDVWRGVLGDAVRGEGLLGRERAGACFKGVETCGLDAGELHGHGEVEGRVKGAVGRLVGGEEGEEGGDVGVVVLGCAGMVGMEAWVREVVGEGVRVVDGVRAGVGVLQGLVRGGF